MAPLAGDVQRRVPVPVLPADHIGQVAGPQGRQDVAQGHVVALGHQRPEQAAVQEAMAEGQAVRQPEQVGEVAEPLEQPAGDEAGHDEDEREGGNHELGERLLRVFPCRAESHRWVAVGNAPVDTVPAAVENSPPKRNYTQQ